MSAVAGASAGLRAVFVQSSISVKWGIGCLGVGRARTGRMDEQLIVWDYLSYIFAGMFTNKIIILIKKLLNYRE